MKYTVDLQSPAGHTHWFEASAPNAVAACRDVVRNYARPATAIHFATETGASVEVAIVEAEVLGTGWSAGKYRVRARRQRD